MTPLKGSLPVIASMLALSACSDPSNNPPAAPTATAASAAEPSPTTEFRKAPRMNGRGKITSIRLEDFFLLQQEGKALVFDARPAFIHKLGSIPGSINLTKQDCDRKIHEREAEIKQALADGKTIVVYCSGALCPDARTVAIHLSGFGYPASVFSGGWDSWTEAGMPTQ